MLPQVAQVNLKSAEFKPVLIAARATPRLPSALIPAVSTQDALFRSLLHRLLGHLLGGSLSLVIERDVAHSLPLNVLSFIWLVAQRLFISTPSNLNNPVMLRVYPWRYGALALYLSVILRDPTLLLTWLQSRLQALSLFQHQNYFRILGLTLRNAVTAPTQAYQLRGVHLYVVGKISVTGNARSRAFYSYAGQTGAANLTLRSTRGFTLVRTRTGCLGLTLQYFF